ncbi:sulfite exporter TauE/SafE family protein [Actinomycetospora straminea]|uniref:Probable membrane transporter protein n=1 Tax=Actinomycetospora straminea TaxID=663607 RepID=A0ABP9EIE7_9PSEU|nr:sulfite exporter TauE/SafE family protein [Actinomycetospora straminea]MDD7936708.1 sulfite exporter TauE/SafE family protein [Actinomycetospora straminea]
MARASGTAHDVGSEGGSRAGIATIGLVGGVVGGLIGGGSGVLFVPALDRFTAMTRARVHGTSTIANIGVCVAGAAAYAVGGGALDLRVGTGMLVGGTFGGLLGPWLLARARETVLRVLLIAILLLTAGKFTLDAVDPALFSQALVPADLLADPWFVVPTTVLVGLVIGAWSGAMGLGGGLLAVPALVLLFGVELHVAAGTSLLMFIPNTIVGSVVHVRQGTASARWGWLLGLTAAPGVVAGALLGLALDAEVLGLVFAVFALLMAIREILALRRRSRRRHEVR